MLKRKKTLRRMKWSVVPESLLDKRADFKFQFRDALSKRIIDRRVKDLAAIYDISGSAVVETVLTDALLPQNEKARQYVSQVLFGEVYSATARAGVGRRGGQQLQSSPYRIKDAAIDIFRENAYPTSDTMLPLMRLLAGALPAHNVEFGGRHHDETSRAFLLGKFDSLTACVEESKEDVDKGKRWLRDAEIFRLQLGAESPAIYPFNYIEAVIQLWPIFKAQQATYEYLAEFLRHLEDWDDTPHERALFQAACVEIFSDARPEPGDGLDELVIEPSRLSGTGKEGRE